MTSAPAMTDYRELEIKYTALSLAANSFHAALLSYYKRNREDLRSVIYDVMLYIPEAAEPSECQALLQCVESDELSVAGADDLLVSAVEEEAISTLDISKNAVKRALDELQLRSLSIDEFLVERVRNISLHTGLIDTALRLLKSCPNHCQDWRRGIIGPISALRACGLEKEIDDFEKMTLREAVDLLLDTSMEDELEQVFGEVLVPWAYYKEVSTELCAMIRTSISESEETDLRSVLRLLSAVIQSGLEQQSKSMIASGVMLACYTKSAASTTYDHVAELQTIAAILANSFRDEQTDVPDISDFEFVDYDDFAIKLLNEESPLNRLIIPGRQSIAILRYLIQVSTVVGSVQQVVEIVMGNEERQSTELRRMLTTPRNTAELRQFRMSLLEQAVLPKLSNDTIEYSLLKAFLLSGDCDQAKRIYVTASPRPLKSKIVEKAILESFNEKFAIANSLSRRELAPAAQILGIIHPKHTNAEIRSNQLMVDTLIELSAYKGSEKFEPNELQHYDASKITNMFSRILQESGNYKKHFRLLGLYQNLSLALKQPALEVEFNELVVNSALSFDDLDFALEFVEEKSRDIREASNTANSTTTPSPDTQDDSWRLLYQVCKYPSDSPAVIHKQLSLLETAISICPADNINELLILSGKLEAACEIAEIAAARMQADTNSQRDTHEIDNDEMEFEPWGSDDDDAMDDAQNDDQGSTRADARPSGQAAMPQWRLFEAAQAASRSAREYLPKTDASHHDSEEVRIRKRDQLAGLVEQKFTSGLGWIRKITLIIPAQGY